MSGEESAATLNVSASSASVVSARSGDGYGEYGAPKSQRGKRSIAVLTSGGDSQGPATRYSRLTPRFICSS